MVNRLIMKRNILLILALSFISLSAQNSYDASRLFSQEQNGTARFVGMGGAMSALGGDISVMSTNPAGIGVYRGQDVALSLSVDNVSATSRYAGGRNVNNNNATKFSFDNIGIVLANRVDDSSIKFVNLGLAYKRNANFNRKFAMSAALENSSLKADDFSQVYEMMTLYNTTPFDVNDMSYKNYTSLNYNWLALMGYEANLYSIDGSGPYIHYRPTNLEYYSEEKGGVDEVDLNLSMNINDRFYLGATLGFYSVNYNRYSYYGEDDALGEIYTLHNWLSTAGAGFDLKVGAIVRPFAESPFKFGVAFHTPTWYTLADRTSARLENPMDGYTVDTQDLNAYGEDYIANYRLTTPWRVNVSAAYTFGRLLALDAEYEYADYSSVGMVYFDGYDNYALNDEFESNLKNVHTVRVGAEVRLSGNVSLRGGYNYVSAPYRRDAAKYMIAVTDTNTEFLNRFDTHSATLGLGYYYKNIYADFAYRYSLQCSDFYPYYDSEIQGPSSSVRDVRNHFVLTIGGRF